MATALSGTTKPSPGNGPAWIPNAPRPDDLQGNVRLLKAKAEEDSARLPLATGLPVLRRASPTRAEAMSRHACAVCGKRDQAERMVYSRWTNDRYCVDIDACKRRSKRQKRGG